MSMKKTDSEKRDKKKIEKAYKEHYLKSVNELKSPKKDIGVYISPKKAKELKEKRMKEYREANKGKLKKLKKEYYIKYRNERKNHVKEYKEKNDESLNKRKEAYYLANKDKIKEAQKNYRNEYKGEIEKYKKEYKLNHKADFKDGAEKYYDENREKMKRLAKNYINEHEGEIKKYMNEYYKEHDNRMKNKKVALREDAINKLKDFYKQDDLHCMICGKPLSYNEAVIDRVIDQSYLYEQAYGKRIRNRFAEIKNLASNNSFALKDYDILCNIDNKLKGYIFNLAISKQYNQKIRKNAQDLYLNFMPTKEEREKAQKIFEALNKQVL